MTNLPTDDDALVAESIAIAEVPIIDFAPFLNGGADERQAVADAVVHACETIGFFYMVGHGVPKDLRSSLFDRALEFFHLPREAKERSRVTPEWNRGWIISDAGATPDANSRIFEQYRIQREVGADDPRLGSGSPFFQPNRWPAEVDGFDRDALAYYDALSRVSSELLHAFALGLGLAENRFDPFFDDSVSQISLMYYPPLPTGSGNEIKNLSAHTDEGPVVLLAQGEVGGLELKTADGRWIAAPPVPGAFTVNIGNMMMRWSNGRLRSTLHRVRNTSAQERLSVPFFWNANSDCVVAPLPELVERDGEAKFPPVRVEDLLGRFYKSSVYIPFEEKAQS
jgi:isopenicillin N synthase-like dioxygenase